MKTISHLSPSSIATFLANREEFYLNYLSDKRPPRLPQTVPMSIGSAFDSYVKSFMHEKLIGPKPEFEFQTLFEAQVEPQNRDFALQAGKHCFDIYMKSGALADLMVDINRGIGKPKFELEIKGVVNGYREGVTKETAEGVVFLGKPDLFFINKEGAHVILDWKVSGYVSRYNTSPMQGYTRLREITALTGMPVFKGCHKDAIVMPFNGIMINHAGYLEEFNEDWARQLAIYSWLLGIEVGTEFICAVDQLVCNNKGNFFDPKDYSKYRPEIRIAEHRLKISKDFQWKTFAQAQEIWEIVHSDWIFRDVAYEISVAKQKELDGLGAGTMSEKDQWFFNSTRG